ncbi:ABC transporter G family member 7 [Nosema granulosis]|uniref:ABC transporter G family member 7 n=1 Tax=Nosema granulosis TaxID=83296 RepID=A0A9P6H0N0_9MICR|nr:ABC transporter G family member 7 [Nosema granulosis]
MPENSIKHDNVDLKQDNVDLKHDNVDLKQDNVDFKHNNVDLKHDNVDFKHDNVDFKQDNVDLLWNDVTVKTRDKNNIEKLLLSDCFGRALSSKITAIFGTIGSGKTTLLRALSGRLDKSEIFYGEILINDRIKGSESWIHTIAFVDNKFDFMKFQTVFETVYFAVKILKGDEEEETIKNKTIAILNTVGLSHIQLEDIMSMSDGEKKLLSIGVSLAEAPTVLILDDPFVSLDVCHITPLLRLFRKLTLEGKTIVFTFKNPNDKLISFIDYIVLIIRGTTIFEGTYKQCQKHFYNCGFENTSDMSFIEFVYSVVDSEECSEYENIETTRIIKEKWLATRNEAYKESFPIEIENIKTEQIYKMILVLKRLFVTTYRNEEMFYGLLVQKLFLFVAAALVYPRIGFTQADIPTRIGIVSFFILNATERSGTVVMSTFEEYKKVTIREIFCGLYSPTEAYWAKFFYNSILGFVFSVLYIIPVYWLADVNRSFWRFTLFILNQFTLTNFIVAYSIVIGIYTKSHLSAHIRGSLLLMFFIVFSGIFVNINTIGDHARWITWLSPMYYAYESNLQVSMSNLTFTCDKESCLSTGQHVIDELGANRIHYFPALVIQWGFILIFILIGWFSFIKKYKPKIIKKNNGMFNKFILK